MKPHHNLMQQSPNLSDEVMIAALQKYEIPNVLLTQILASNPSATQSMEVQAAMDNRPIPFDEYQQEQIALGLFMISSRTNLEDLMGEKITDREVALRCLIAEIEADESITDKDASIAALLNEDTYYNDLLAKANMLAAKGEYVHSKTLLTSAASMFPLAHQDEVDMDALANVFDIEEELTSLPTPVISSSQISELESMLNTTTAIVSTRALDLLIEYANREYIEPIIDDEPDLRSMQVSKEGKGKTMVRVYPNPAHDMVTLEYSSGGVASIELYDLSGRLIQSQQTNTNALQFILLIKDLSPGLYEARLFSASNAIITTATIVKQ